MAISIALMAIIASTVICAVPHQSRDQVLPASADLRPQFESRGLTMKKQGARGTCSVFAVTGALEFALAPKQGSATRLSVEFLNWAAHKATGRTADGGFFSEIWRGFRQYGICADSEMPYHISFDPERQPSESALAEGQSRRSAGLRIHWIKKWNPHTGVTDEQIDDIKRALASGSPVCGGFRWPKTARWRRSVLQMCPPEEVFDGHSVLLVGYKDNASIPGGGAFTIRDSGGHWPEGELPYDYVRAYLNDAIWIQFGSKSEE